MNFILAVSDHKIKALLTQVQAKWDIITMLCLLVFCLAFAAAFYAALRPESMARKVVTFLVALGVGYGLSYVTITTRSRANSTKWRVKNFGRMPGIRRKLASKVRV